MTQNSW